jgi:lipopolysaccharide exporter
MTSVSRQIASGIAWMSLMRAAIKGLGLLSTVILARLLVPADFGLVAMATSVISALELLRAFNFDVALIQRQDADRSFYDAAWTLNILFGAALAALVLAASVPAAKFFGEPRLQAVVQVLALGVLVSGTENIGVVAFRKELAFRKEFALRIVQKTCGMAVTLAVAFIYRSYWALVIGMVSGSAFNVLLSYYAHPFRPRLSLRAKGHLLNFSKWLMANDFIWFARDRTPDFVLGRVIGPSALGVFSISMEISNLPTTELVGSINRAVLPTYAKVASDLVALRRGFLDVVGLIAMLALPAGFGIAATADRIISVALGDKWTAAIPLVSVLAVFGSLNALTSNCNAVQIATGKPSTATWTGFAQVLILVPTLVLSAYAYGPQGVAWAYLASVALLNLPLNFAFALRRLSLPFASIGALLWRPFVATVAMYLVTTQVGALLPSGIVGLVGAVAVGTAVYSAMLVLLWLVAGRPAGPEKTVVSKLVAPAFQRMLAGRANG